MLLVSEEHFFIEARSEKSSRQVANIRTRIDSAIFAHPDPTDPFRAHHAF